MFILIIIFLMLTGIAIGYLLRSRNTNIIRHIITVLIWSLLFLLGTEVGTNHSIINGLQTIGLKALTITAFSVLGSSAAAWLLWQYILQTDKKGRKRQ